MSSPALLSARQLLQVRSPADVVAVLARAPYLDPASFIELCRTSELYGFSPTESEWLKARASLVSLVLRALADELSPDIPAEIYGYAGREFRLQGNFERARRFYKMDFHNASNPGEQAAALCSLGILLVQESKLEEAKAMVERARRVAERNQVRGATLFTILNTLGLVERQAENFEEAISQFEKAGQTAYDAQSYVLAHVNVAAAAQAAKKVARALAALDEIRPIVEQMGGPMADAYYELRRDLEGSGVKETPVIPDGLAAAVSAAFADPAKLPELRRQLLQAPGSFEALAQALLEPDGPIRSQLRQHWQQTPGSFEAFTKAMLESDGTLRDPSVEGEFRVVRLLRKVALQRGSWGALAETTLHLCRFGAGSPTECIDWLEETLQHFDTNVPFSAGTTAMKAWLHDTLGNAYLRRGPTKDSDLRAAIHHWQEVLRFLDSGRKGDSELAKIMQKSEVGDEIARTHFKIGNALNALRVHSRGSEPEAIRHFQAALENLSDSPSNAGLRTEITNNLGNALAYQAEASWAMVSTGQRDQAALLKSLDLQSSLLETLENDPEARCQALNNIITTYRELSQQGPYAAQEYLRAATECLQSAQAIVAQIREPKPELLAMLALDEALLALDRNLPPPDLILIREKLAYLLGTLVHHLLPQIAAKLYNSTVSIEERLGRRRLAYRRMCSAIALLHSELGLRDKQGEARATALAGIEGRLTGKLLSWNEVQRALFFANAERARRRNSAESIRRYLPRSGHWACPPQQAVIQFAADLKQATAFVVTPEGVRTYAYDFNPLKLIHLTGNWMNAMLDAAKAESGESQAKKWEAQIASMAEYVGRMLFDPLTSMLPEGGELAVVSDYSMLLLPLHLAVFHSEPAKRLMERFAVRSCEYLDFESARAEITMSRVQRSIVVAAYSPPEARLPFAAMEAAAVAATAEAQVETLREGQATPEAVLRGIETHSVVHLCCHGSWSWDDPLDSHLTLAGRPLSLREIAFQLEQSNCELIVLSACEAGTRTELDGGFAPVFLGAGCKSFLAASWRVDDLATTLLLGRFYEEWIGSSSVAAALGRAQMWLAGQTGEHLAEQARALYGKNRSSVAAENQYIESRLNELAAFGTAQPFAHPKFWGAFSVIERMVTLVRPSRSRVLASG